MTRARAARHCTADGLESYEGTLRQRMYVELTALRCPRERGLLGHERIANIRWSFDGSRVIQWTGMRSVGPISGLDTGKPGEQPAVRIAYSDSSGSIRAGAEANEELAEDMATDLLDETDMRATRIGPSTRSRIALRSTTASHQVTAHTSGCQPHSRRVIRFRWVFPAPSRWRPGPLGTIHLSNGSSSWVAQEH